MKTYRIAFSGLALGKHDFSFDIDKEFFDCFPYSIVKDGDLKADVVLEKQTTMLLAHIHIHGTVRLTCDVCLREFDRPTDIHTRLVIKFTDEDLDESSDEIMVLGRNDYEFSLADVFYEHINLSVPPYVRCEELAADGGCDEEMMEKLRALSVWETEATTDEEESVDPRWEKLKNLKKNS